MWLTARGTRPGFWPAGLAKAKEATLWSCSGLELELEVLGVEVVDADIAVLTATAVAGSKGRSREYAQGSVPPP